MKTKKLLCISIITLVLTACVGDVKIPDAEEMGDTTSFINEDFKGNRIDYDMNQSACEGVTKADIAELYGVSADLVRIMDNVNSDRRDSNAQPVCQFYIESGDNDFMWLRGSMAIKREMKKEEYPEYSADVSEHSENWEEMWAQQKSISKSSEWVSDLGKAAVWVGKYHNLKIKFEGYTLSVNPPRNVMNKEEQALNRDYKKMAIKIAKLSDYVN